MNDIHYGQYLALHGRPPDKQVDGHITRILAGSNGLVWTNIF
jgi:hypothetical protein